MSKDEIRSAVLGQQRNSEIYTLETDDGQVEVELRELTFTEKKDIERMIGNDETEFDDHDRTLLWMLKCAYVPDSDERVFSKADIQSMKESPGNQALEQLEFGVLHVNGKAVLNEETEEDDKKN